MIDDVLVLSSSMAWKVVLAVLLVAAIAVSLRARAPRRPIRRAELRRLVLSALTLYGVGVFASLTHHVVLGAAAYVAGICACALAGWLSRGSDSEDPPGGGKPGGGPPPPGTEGAAPFDWRAFERDFRRYAERRREPTGAN